MKWEFWISQYLDVHCTARGLASKSICAYRDTLKGFRGYVAFRLGERSPDQLSPRDILEYVEYLRKERQNGTHAVNRQVTVLRNFYRAMVAMECLDPRNNPMANFPKIKGAPKKLPVFLSVDEMQRLLDVPRTCTVMGLRDRALLTLLYATGIRATECAEMKDANVDLEAGAIRVMGKGGNERCIPIGEEVMHLLRQYRTVRGPVGRRETFFKSRGGKMLSRSAIYERVHRYGRKAKIEKEVTPHRLRHTFATHLMERGRQVREIQALLGHRCISSTQIYLHTTAQDLRKAAMQHPVENLISRIPDLLPNVKVPFQWLPGEKTVRAG
jgi:site-specific recombinase XerD